LTRDIAMSSEPDRSPADSRVNPIDQIRDLVERYRLRAHRAGRAHYLAGKRFGVMHVRLGVPVVSLSTIVGSAIFATLTATPNAILTVVAGLTSIAAATLAALQTFFGYSERAGKHRLAGAQYSALKREFDLLALGLRTASPNLDMALELLNELTQRLKQHEQESPDVPDRYYDQARREQAGDTEGI